jgi:hypothetical protein
MQEHMLLHTRQSAIQNNKCQSWSCSKVVYKPVRHIPLLSEQWINSWWWTDELAETCRVSRQNKFVKLVHLVRFITKKFVTMHSHTNVKKMSYFTYNWHNRCLDLTVYQVTNHNDFSELAAPELTHASACLIMNCRTLSKAPGLLRRVKNMLVRRLSNPNWRFIH